MDSNRSYPVRALPSSSSKARAIRYTPRATRTPLLLRGAASIASASWKIGRRLIKVTGLRDFDRTKAVLHSLSQSKLD
jgi:hypothetical protein